MDIIKQISILLWVLGAVLIAPPVLRHFDIDVKTAYSKVLGIKEKRDAPEDQKLKKRDIDPQIFNELFKELPPDTQADRAKATQEFEEMIAGLERISSVSYSSYEAVMGVPAPFRADPKAKEKVRWMPPPAGFLTGETFNYLIYRERNPVGDKLKTVLDTIHGNLMLDLTPFTLVAKPNKILVMLFGEKESYMTFTKRPPWSGAASDLRSDTMYVIEGNSFYPLSVHELTHLYFDGFFLPSISPLWLSEGMAVYMQIYATHQKPSWIDPNISRILHGEYIPLDQMILDETLSSLNTQQAELWYTQAYSLMDYLLNERSRDEFYRFCNELKNGTPVHQALYRAYGMPFTKMSVLQNVWLHDLSKHAQGHLFLADNQGKQKNASPQPQKTVTPQSVAPKPKQTAAHQPSQKTVIPKLEMVPTHGYTGGF